MVRPGASPEAGGAVARLRGDAEPSAAVYAPRLHPEALARAEVTREEIFKITLCGSTRFRADYELWNKRLTLAGFLVYSVSGFGHSGDDFTEEEKRRLDQIHLAKIDDSHAIVVVGNGYVGASTRREIEHALSAGKAVYSTAHALDLPAQTARRVRYVYGLRTGPLGTQSLRYRAFDYGAPTSPRERATAPFAAPVSQQPRDEPNPQPEAKSNG